MRPSRRWSGRTTSATRSSGGAALPDLRFPAGGAPSARHRRAARPAPALDRARGLTDSRRTPEFPVAHLPPGREPTWIECVQRSSEETAWLLPVDALRVREPRASRQDRHDASGGRQRDLSRRRQGHGIVTQMGCAAGREFEIELALREALANAIEHGSGNDPSKQVECCVACDHERGMLIVVRDPGPGFDPSRSRARSSARISSRPAAAGSTSSISSWTRCASKKAAPRSTCGRTRRDRGSLDDAARRVWDPSLRSG